MGINPKLSVPMLMVFACGALNAGIPVKNGAGTLTLGLGLDFGRDSNPDQLETSPGKSSFNRLKPTIGLIGQTEFSTFNVDLSGEIQRYNDNTGTTRNGQLSGGWQRPINQHLEFRFGASAFQDSETAFNLSGDEESADFRDYSYGPEIVYGGRDSKMQLSLGINADKRRYLQSELGENSAKHGVNLNVDWNVRPKTRLHLGLGYKNIDYKKTEAIDGGQQDFNVGVSWEALNKTSGVLRFGVTDRSYKQSVHSDHSEETAEVELSWTPLVRSRFVLTIAKVLDDTNETGGFVLNDTFSKSLTWDHEWSDVWHSDVSYGVSDIDYINRVSSLTSDKSEEITSLTVGVDRQISRDWSVRLTVFRENKKGVPETNANYEQEVHTIGVNWSL